MEIKSTKQCVYDSVVVATLDGEFYKNCCSKSCYQAFNYRKVGHAATKLSAFLRSHVVLLYAGGSSPSMPTTERKSARGGGVCVILPSFRNGVHSRMAGVCWGRNSSRDSFINGWEGTLVSLFLPLSCLMDLIGSMELVLAGLLLPLA